MNERVSDGRKMVIYERFFRPNLRYTIEEAYAFIEQEAPDVFKNEDDAAEFQAKVLAHFPVREPGEW